MRFNILGSGSSGNATLVEAGETRVLVDCGLSPKELAKRLAEAGETADRICAVIITHEHSDHIKGLPTLCKSLNLTVHISKRALNAARIKDAASLTTGEQLRPLETFEIGSLQITPLRVPHDSVDPLVFRLEHKGVRMAIVTDLGHIPTYVSEQLRGCDALIIEANHDLDRLKACRYPWSLKQRVLSRNGHLSNNETARFLREDFDGKARHIILAHLSRENNHPEVARLMAEEALASRAPLFAPLQQDLVKVAPPDQPLGWIEL